MITIVHEDPLCYIYKGLCGRFRPGDSLQIADIARSVVVEWSTVEAGLLQTSPLALLQGHVVEGLQVLARDVLAASRSIPLSGNPISTAAEFVCKAKHICKATASLKAWKITLIRNILLIKQTGSKSRTSLVVWILFLNSALLLVLLLYLKRHKITQLLLQTFA